MGMDVHGLEPRSETGSYFRRNVWHWRPLAELVCTMAPDVCAACTHWQSNDGDGLDAESALALASELKAAQADGRIKAYIAIRDALLQALPRVTCRHCEGTGIRSDEIGVKYGMPLEVITEPGHPRHGETGTCNACNGIGSSPAFETHYFLDERDVAEFTAFLEDCGGFVIC